MMNTSKRRRSTKAAAAGTILLAVMLAASACGNNGSVNTENDEQGAVNQGPVVDLPEDSGILEPDVSAPEPTAEPNTDNGSSEDPKAEPVQTGEGSYTGLMDSHSIEIVTAEGAMAFQITEEQYAVVENFPADAKVKFEYTQKAIEGEADTKQNWLVKIEEMK